MTLHEVYSVFFSFSLCVTHFELNFMYKTCCLNKIYYFFYYCFFFLFIILNAVYITPATNHTMSLYAIT